MFSLLPGFSKSFKHPKKERKQTNKQNNYFPRTSWMHALADHMQDGSLADAGYWKKALPSQASRVWLGSTPALDQLSGGMLPRKGRNRCKSSTRPSAKTLRQWSDHPTKARVALSTLRAKWWWVALMTWSDPAVSMRHVQHYPRDKKNKGASMTITLWRAIYGCLGLPSAQNTEHSWKHCFVFQDTSSKFSHEADTPDLCTDAASVHPEEQSPCPPESSPTGAGQLLIAQREGPWTRQIMALVSTSALLASVNSLYHSTAYAERCRQSPDEIHRIIWQTSLIMPLSLPHHLETWLWPLSLFLYIYHSTPIYGDQGGIWGLVLLPLLKVPDCNQGSTLEKTGDVGNTSS